MAQAQRQADLPNRNPHPSCMQYMMNRFSLCQCMRCPADRDWRDGRAKYIRVQCLGENAGTADVFGGFWKLTTQISMADLPVNRQAGWDSDIGLSAWDGQSRNDNFHITCGGRVGGRVAVPHG